MNEPQLEIISVTLRTTMGTEEWEVKVPLDVPVAALIQKFIRTPQLGFRERDDEGNRIPYRLMHQEGNKFLGDTETLREADAQEGHTLVMTFFYLVVHLLVLI